MERGPSAEMLSFWILCARKGVEGSGWGCGSVWILRGATPSFPSQRTTNSELVRTRGIRLFN